MSYQKPLENPIKSLGRAFWKALYPPHCLHCDGYLDTAKILCNSCQSLLELIEHQRRCPYCFSSEKISKWGMCRECYSKPQSFNAFGSVFDEEGPVYELIRNFRSGKSYLSESLGGYLFLQWSRFGWPSPDIVVPVAGSLSRWIQRGYHPGGLLAKEMGFFLERPIVNALKRSSYQMEEPRFSLRKKADLQDRIVLLIDDRYDSGKTMNRAAEALREGAPAKIFGMTVSRKLE